MRLVALLALLCAPAAAWAGASATGDWLTGAGYRGWDGRARLELGRTGEGVLKEEVVTAGDAFHFPPGTVHRVTAIEDTTILEVSTPQLDDVVRLEDRYGREGTSTP